ncbi:MAG: tyrosine-type recombinase/integrase, partial [Planctomycetaceae bacterium]
IEFRTALAARYAPSRLSKSVVVCRMIFNWGIEADLLPPLKFGKQFAVASQKQKRVHRHTVGKKLLDAKEIKAILTKSDATLKAMLLLAINGGFGNADIAALPLSAIDLNAGVVDFPRPKTGVQRRVPLWPETVAALKQVLESRRPKPEFSSLVFVTPGGSPYITIKENKSDPQKIVRVDQIIPLFSIAAKAAGVHRPRMGFYWLRHTFQTIGDDARDPVATKHLMGHIDDSMSDNYRESISDERLRAVVDHVRDWLFEPKPAEAGKAKLKLRAG